MILPSLISYFVQVRQSPSILLSARPKTLLAFLYILITCPFIIRI